MSKEEKEYYESIIKLLQNIKEDLKGCLKGDESNEKTKDEKQFEIYDTCNN